MLSVIIDATQELEPKSSAEIDYFWRTSTKFSFAKQLQNKKATVFTHLPTEQLSLNLTLRFSLKTIRRSIKVSSFNQETIELIADGSLHVSVHLEHLERYERCILYLSHLRCDEMNSTQILVFRDDEKQFSVTWHEMEFPLIPIVGARPLVMLWDLKQGASLLDLVIEAVSPGVHAIGAGNRLFLLGLESSPYKQTGDARFEAKISEFGVKERVYEISGRKIASRQFQCELGPANSNEVFVNNQAVNRPQDVIICNSVREACNEEIFDRQMPDFEQAGDSEKLPLGPQQAQLIQEVQEAQLPQQPQQVQQTEETLQVDEFNIIEPGPAQLPMQYKISINEAKPPVICPLNGQFPIEDALNCKKDENSKHHQPAPGKKEGKSFAGHRVPLPGSPPPPYILILQGSESNKIPDEALKCDEKTPEPEAESLKISPRSDETDEKETESGDPDPTKDEPAEFLPDAPAAERDEEPSSVADDVEPRNRVILVGKVSQVYKPQISRKNAKQVSNPVIRREIEDSNPQEAYNNEEYGDNQDNSAICKPLPSANMPRQTISCQTTEKKPDDSFCTPSGAKLPAFERQNEHPRLVEPDNPFSKEQLDHVEEAAEESREPLKHRNLEQDTLQSSGLPGRGRSMELPAGSTLPCYEPAFKIINKHIARSTIPSEHQNSGMRFTNSKLMYSSDIPELRLEDLIALPKENKQKLQNKHPKGQVPLVFELPNVSMPAGSIRLPNGVVVYVGDSDPPNVLMQTVCMRSGKFQIDVRPMPDWEPVLMDGVLIPRPCEKPIPPRAELQLHADNNVQVYDQYPVSNVPFARPHVLRKPVKQQESKAASALESIFPNSNEEMSVDQWECFKHIKSAIEYQDEQDNANFSEKPMHLSVPKQHSPVDKIVSKPL